MDMAPTIRFTWSWLALVGNNVDFFVLQKSEIKIKGIYVIL